MLSDMSTHWLLANDCYSGCPMHTQPSEEVYQTSVILVRNMGLHTRVGL